MMKRKGIQNLIQVRDHLDRNAVQGLALDIFQMPIF